MPPSETLFVTYRLYNTLPHSVLLEMQLEHLDFLANQKEKTPDIPEKEIHQKWKSRCFLTIDTFINKATVGDSYLSDSHIATIVKESIHYRDKSQFDLHAYCIMPNHVHLLITNTRNDVPFYRVLGSLKANSAKAINEHLNRTGQPFWAFESYDHAVRNGKSFARILNYILYNPVKAGLVRDWEEWPHSYCQYDW